MEVGLDHYPDKDAGKVLVWNSALNGHWNVSTNGSIVSISRLRLQTCLYSHFPNPGHTTPDVAISLRTNTVMTSVSRTKGSHTSMPIIYTYTM